MALDLNLNSALLRWQVTYGQASEPKSTTSGQVWICMDWRRDWLLDTPRLYSKDPVNIAPVRSMPDPETQRGSPALTRLRFGTFELDRASGVLLRDGVEVKLQPQPLAVLTALVERAPDEVTREELRARLWPDGTFVEFEGAIGTAIRKIRQALGDSAESPVYVKTIYRSGFRFIAPVHPVMPLPATKAPADLRVVTPVAPAPVTPGEPRESLGRWKRKPVVAGAVALIAVAAFLTFGVLRWFWPAGHSHPPLTVTPLTSFAFDEYDPVSRPTVGRWFSPGRAKMTRTSTCTSLKWMGRGGYGGSPPTQRATSLPPGRRTAVGSPSFVPCAR